MLGPHTKGPWSLYSMTSCTKKWLNIGTGLTRVEDFQKGYNPDLLPPLFPSDQPVAEEAQLKGKLDQ